MVNHIAFPGLSIGPFAVAESFQIFGFTIHWYGVIIMLGIVAAYLFCSRVAPYYGLTKENALDIIIFGLPTAIVCARIYYVVFEWESYKDSWTDIFKIWEGGLAIYGGVIGACISTCVYCKVKKIPVLKAFDLGAFGLLLGQMIGRWGNFVNAEAYGAETMLPWRMHLLDLGIMVHPTFLYESLWNLSIFLILLWRRKKTTFDGEIFFSYITFYGIGRFWIESLRLDSLYLGNIRVSQFMALICVFVGISVIVYCKKKKSLEQQ